MRRGATSASGQGSGQRFVDEMHARVLDVVTAPERFPEISPRVYRAPSVGRFPHVLVFRVYGDEVRFYAVMHPRRRPGYWAKRLP